MAALKIQVSATEGDVKSLNEGVGKTMAEGGRLRTQLVGRWEVCARLLFLLEEERKLGKETKTTMGGLKVRVSDLEVKIGERYERESHLEG